MPWRKTSGVSCSTLDPLFGSWGKSGWDGDYPVPGVGKNCTGPLRGQPVGAQITWTPRTPEASGTRNWVTGFGA